AVEVGGVCDLQTERSGDRDQQQDKGPAPEDQGPGRKKDEMVHANPARYSPVASGRPIPFRTYLSFGSPGTGRNLGIPNRPRAAALRTRSVRARYAHGTQRLCGPAAPDGTRRPSGSVVRSGWHWPCGDLAAERNDGGVPAEAPRTIRCGLATPLRAPGS